MLNYNFIVNPETGRKVKVSGKIGKYILMRYLHKTMLGGGAKWNISENSWYADEDRASSDYSEIEASILNSIGIVPTNDIVRRNGLVNGLDEFFKIATFKENFNMSLNEALRNLKLENLIEIGNQIIEAL